MFIIAYGPKYCTKVKGDKVCVEDFTPPGTVF